MAEITIPVVTSLNIEEFSVADITEASSVATNAIFEEYPEGDVYATQRPSVNTKEDASDPTFSVSDTQGRGCFYWEDTGNTYIVNNDTVYIDSYGGTTKTITAGVERVYFAEIGGYLVLLDPENNKGWIFDTSNNMDQMTGTTGALTGGASYDFTNFPSSIEHGVAVLNQKMYVLNNTSQLWSHATGDPLDWSSASNFLTAEFSEDKAKYIDRHHNDIVVFGSKTTEFFYDAANSGGSSLLARTDVQHNIGVAEPKSVWTENDETYFMGNTQSGEIGIYKLEKYQLRKVSNPTIDSFLSSNMLINNMSALACGFSSGGRAYYCVTLYTGTTTVAPSKTFVYNNRTETWSRWEHASSAVTAFPLVAWSTDTSLVKGRGIFANGDYIEIYDDFNPQDSVGENIYWTPFNSSGTGYTTDDYGYVALTDASGDNIEMVIQIPHRNEDTSSRKFMDKLRIISDITPQTETVLVQWSDAGHKDSDFNAGRTIDLSRRSSKLNRLGDYRERTYRLTYSGDEQIRIRGLRCVVREGSN